MRSTNWIRRNAGRVFPPRERPKCLTANSFPDKNIGHTWHQAVRGMTVAAVRRNERIVRAGLRRWAPFPPGGGKHMRRSSKPWARALAIAVALLMDLTFS